jgi:stage II sporulation protein M
MEREEDYYLQGRNEEGKSEITEGEEKKETTLPADTFSVSSGEVRTQPGGRSTSRRSGFTDYVRFIWPYLLFITLVFFGALITGYASAENFPDMADKLMQGFSTRFAPLMSMSPIFVMLGIFLNNAFVSLLFLVLGLALGILPVLFVAFNGYVVGVISYVVSQERGLLFIFLALLPHGIVELPMVFLSAGIGLRLGHQVFAALIGRPTEIKKEFKEGLSFYFRWILPLLLLAAIVETFITPLILSFL